MKRSKLPSVIQVRDTEGSRFGLSWRFPDCLENKRDYLISSGSGHILKFNRRDSMAFVQPYVFFDGKCDEAIKFYSSAVGAQTQMLMRYKDCPDPQACKPGTEDKVMHANVKIRDTEVLMADGHCGGNPKFEGFGLALQAKDNDDAE